MNIMIVALVALGFRTVARERETQAATAAAADAVNTAELKNQLLLSQQEFVQTRNTELKKLETNPKTKDVTEQRTVTTTQMMPRTVTQVVPDTSASTTTSTRKTKTS